MKSRLLAGLLACAFVTPLAARSQAQDPASPYFAVQAELDQWRSRHGENWQMVYDKEAGRGRFLFGGSAPAPFVPRTEADFFQLARLALGQSQPIHQVDLGDLFEASALFLPLSQAGTTDKWTVEFRQVRNGVPVVGGFANVLMDLEGRLLSVDTTAAPRLAGFSTSPNLPAARAEELATQWFVTDTGVTPTSVGAAGLVIDQVVRVKERVPVLAWEVTVHHDLLDGQPQGYVYRVDAQDGSQVAREDAVHFFDVSGNVKSFATPGVIPDKTGNSPTSQDMPHIRLTSGANTANADANGNFNFSGLGAPINYTVTYLGSYCRVVNQAGSNYSLAGTLSSASGNQVTMNPASSALITAQANAFLWHNEQRLWIKGLNPGDTHGDFQQTANVNIADTCNAYYNGSSTNYYQAGGGCVNTAYSTIVLHEMGHWYNSLYSSGNGSDGFGEGNADVWAMYVVDNSVVGQDFCGTNCNVRNGTNLSQFCGDCCGGCKGEVHADGEVLMGALWKVRTNLKNSLGQSAGALAADTLFLSWMNGYNDTQIKTIIETHWLTLDDDDANLSNGTPNYDEIDGGFLQQGFPGYGITWVGLSNLTQLPTGPSTGPFTVDVDAVATQYPPIGSVSLKYRVGVSGAFVTVPMSHVSGATYTGQIPTVSCPNDVYYHVTATDSAAHGNTYPVGAPTSNLQFSIGQFNYVMNESFENGTSGWTHGTLAGADDWQLSSAVGANISAGESGDPTTPAVSGTSVWGNDLGVGGAWNGAYPNNVDNWLRSPVMDCSGLTGVRLRFRRWLTVEAGHYDHARVKVNGSVVWSNQLFSDTINTAWMLSDIAIGVQANDNPSVQIEFSLDSDGGTTFGGWNIDDVQVYTKTCPPLCPPPINYCTAKLLSNGGVSAAGWLGTNSLAVNDFELTCANAIPGKTGVPYYSQAAAALPFMGGFLCAQPPVLRGAPFTFDANGFVQVPWPIVSGQVGTTDFIGFWFRDPQNPDGTFVGLSDAIEVTYCP